MGRPAKQGFDYFSFDTDFFQDIKVRKLMRYQGVDAVVVYIRLLCDIFRQGYYLKYDEDMAFIISDETGIDEGKVSEIIDCCLKVGLFSEHLFVTEKVLTSKGIQKRYQTMNSLCRRNNPMTHYNLVSSEETLVIAEETRVIAEETPISSEETLVNSAKSTQRKEKKRKGNKIKEDNKENTTDVVSKKVALSSPSPDKIDWVKLKDYFNTTFSGRLATIDKISETRRKAVRARIAQYSKQAVFEVLQKVSESQFLLGANERNWRCDFDWIFKQANFTKIYEGNYDKHNDTKQGRKQSVENLRDLAEKLLTGTATKVR